MAALDPHKQRQRLYALLARRGYDGDLIRKVLALREDEAPPRDELMLKVLMAIELGPEHALAVITRHRTALIALLQLRRRESRGLHYSLDCPLPSDARPPRPTLLSPPRAG